jgi:hypothetical protein
MRASRSFEVPKDKSGFNPFYGLLIVAGVAFCITACAYGVMVYLESQPAAADRGTADHPLLGFLGLHGAKLLTAELALLAVATFGAIGTDGYWKGRGKTER